MSVKATPQAAAEAWKSAFSAAGTKYTAGVNAVTVAPGQLAAAQKSAYVQGVNENQNIWAAKVGAVTLQDWKNASATTGAQRLASGAEKGSAKFASFMQTFLPQLSSIVEGLSPRGSFEQNMQRSLSYATALHAKKGQF
jgi:hypothetical protein